MTIKHELRPSGVWTVALNNPATGNALAPSLVEALIELLQDAKPAPKLMVFSGVGKHFCTGFDLSDLDRLSDGDLLQRFVRIEQLLQLIRHAPFPTMALVQGAAYGAGAELVAACQHRICAPGAKFAFPGPNFGVVIGTTRLASILGSDKALEVIARNSPVPAEEAHALGLATRIVEASDFDRLVDQSLHEFAAETMALLRARAIPDTRDADLAAFVRSAASPGLKERVQAYRERISKRKDPG